MVGRRVFIGAVATFAACRRNGADPVEVASEARPPEVQPAKEGSEMITRTIASSGEALPAIGLGTWATFDVGSSAADRAPLREVLEVYAQAGCRVIDSSPMYGRAEAVAGDLMAELERPMFVATKVWTRGRDAGLFEIERSMQRLRVKTLDLLQVHNLFDVETQLATLRELKAAGAVRYIGVTHYQLSAFDELERLVRSEQLDFVQLPYSVRVREAEARLLPAAADTGTAVLVMRPFEEGALFDAVRGQPLPSWAADIDCTSWAQLFLKWILGHPAVTCPIPATSKPAHARDNVAAAFGRLPNAALRAEIVRLVEA